MIFIITFSILLTVSWVFFFRIKSQWIKKIEEQENEIQSLLKENNLLRRKNHSKNR